MCIFLRLLVGLQNEGDKKLQLDGLTTIQCTALRTHDASRGTTSGRLIQIIEGSEDGEDEEPLSDEEEAA